MTATGARPAGSRRTAIHYHTDCAYFGGCENMLPAFLASEELRAQYDITFSYRFSPTYAEGLRRRIDLDVPVFELRFPEIFDFSLLPQSVPLLLRRMYFLAIRLVGTLPLLLYEVWSLWRLMKRLKPTIVHINNGGYPGALSARAAAIGAKMAGVPVVVMVVNSWAVGYTPVFRKLEYFEDRLVVRLVDQFVTGSAGSSARLREVLRLPEHRSVAVHNGIPFRDATAAPAETLRRLGLEKFEGVLFGSVGNLLPQKGHRVMLDAVVQLIESGNGDMPRFKVMLLGEGPLRATLEEYVRTKGLSDHCLILGERPDIMNYMILFDVLVFPSTWHEDFPFVVLEAMSHGKPVVASNVVGPVEQVVHRETGLLVEPGATAQLAAAMCELASSQQLRREMGEAGRRRFLTDFTSQIAVSRYMSLYRSLTAQHSLPEGGRHG